MKRIFFALFAAWTCALAGCNSGPLAPDGGSSLPPDDPAERARLETLCGCLPAPDGMPFPSGSPDLWCYDGCNWCGCTGEGLGTCTARFCSDAGL